MPEIEMTVQKLSAWTMVAVDADGTPLEHGERMVEAEPGHWMSPVLAAALDFLAPHVAALEHLNDPQVS